MKLNLRYSLGLIRFALRGHPPPVPQERCAAHLEIANWCKAHGIDDWAQVEMDAYNDCLDRE